MPIKVKGVTTITDDGVFVAGAGGTDQRPVSPVVGMTRHNTDLRRPETFNGVEWVALGEAAPETIAYGWGLNSGVRPGRVGDNTVINRSSPVTVVGGVVDWSRVSAGRRHSVALTNSGIVYTWGYNANGRLGVNDTVNRSSPVTVAGGITNWNQISGGDHTLAVTNTGVAYAWGANNSGQLGDNSGNDRSSPVTVVGGITNWSQTSAGPFHSAAITDIGIMYAWGYGGLGQLGTGNTTSRSSPVVVAGNITSWNRVSCGGLHTVAVTDTGSLYAWGFNSSGQLGTGNRTNQSSPVSVTGGITNWSQISAGNYHTAAVTSSGIAYTWGSGSFGRLGTNDIISRSSPVTVVGGITNWSRISSGNPHTVAITDTGQAYSWGRNFDGPLGTGNRTDRSSPVTVVGGITNWNDISTGNEHTIAIATTT